MDASFAQDADRVVEFALQRRASISSSTTRRTTRRGNAKGLPDDEWRRTIDVNLAASLLLPRRARPMLASPRGAIVNISSQSLEWGAPTSHPRTTAAGSSAHRRLRRRSPRGVRVNAIMPALVESRDFGWSAEERDTRVREYRPASERRGHGASLYR
jgi:NAD(P)-dependent dehydrogenase (short-subunit alcohol dehydrogenase family)